MAEKRTLPTTLPTGYGPEYETGAPLGRKRRLVECLKRSDASAHWPPAKSTTVPQELSEMGAGSSGTQAPGPSRFTSALRTQAPLVGL